MERKALLNILFWIFFAIAVILFIWKLVGSTPTVDLILISILAGLVVKIYSSLEDIKEKLGDHSRHLYI